jgi:hypothetical protein
MSTFISEPGTRLGGRYRLEDRVNASAGWSAWKAIDETLARPVAVLTFAPGFPRIREVVTAARAASRKPWLPHMRPAWLTSASPPARCAGVRLAA